MGRPAKICQLPPSGSRYEARTEPPSASIASARRATAAGGAPELSSSGAMPRAQGALGHRGGRAGGRHAAGRRDPPGRGDRSRRRHRPRHRTGIRWAATGRSSPDSRSTGRADALSARSVRRARRQAVLRHRPARPLPRSDGRGAHRRGPLLDAERQPPAGRHARPSAPERPSPSWCPRPRWRTASCCSTPRRRTTCASARSRWPGWRRAWPSSTTGPSGSSRPSSRRRRCSRSASATWRTGDSRAAPTTRCSGASTVPRRRRCRRRWTSARSARRACSSWRRRWRRRSKGSRSAGSRVRTCGRSWSRASIRCGSSAGPRPSSTRRSTR